jgi:hypothetical protein
MLYMIVGRKANGKRFEIVYKSTDKFTADKAAYHCGKLNHYAKKRGTGARYQITPVLDI